MQFIMWLDSRYIILVYDDKDHDDDEVGPNTSLTLMQANDAMHRIAGSSSTSASLPSNDTEQSAASPDCSSSGSLSQLQLMAKIPQFGWLTPYTGRKAFHSGNINWLENYTLGDLLGSPLKYFSAYFSYSLLNLIANQTNQYYLRTIGKEFKTSTEEIRKFFGASIIMVSLGYPHIRMYWFKATRINWIAKSMPLNQYFKIRANIHVNAAIAPDSNNKTKF